MRVLICGSRTFTDQSPIADAMMRLSVKYKDSSEPLVLVHGAAKGADSIAAGIAEQLSDWQIEAHPADWNRYGRRAGYVRNAEMLATGVDLVLAFRSSGESRGTDMMVDLARKAGVPTFVYTAE